MDSNTKGSISPETGMGSSKHQETRSYKNHGLIEAYQDYFKHPEKIGMTSFTDHESTWYRKLPIFVQNILNPWVLGIRVLGSKRVVILREFLSVPFFLSLPLNIFNRKRLVLVLIHNVQLGYSRKLHRVALRSIFGVGFRAVVLESASGVKGLVTAAASRKISELRMPMIERQLPDHRHRDNSLKIGIVGGVRKEKNASPLILKLVRYCKDKKNVELVVGTSNPSAAKNMSPELSYTVIDTTNEEDYVKCLQDLDILVINYRAEDYYYRTSGVILDAISCSTMVVFPDFPIFREQVLNPAPFGIPYSGLDGLNDALDACIGLASVKHDAYLKHANLRGYEGIKTQVQAVEASLINTIT